MGLSGMHQTLDSIHGTRTKGQKKAWVGCQGSKYVFGIEETLQCSPAWTHCSGEKNLYECWNCSSCPIKCDGERQGSGRQLVGTEEVKSLLTENSGGSSLSKLGPYKGSSKGKQTYIERWVWGPLPTTSYPPHSSLGTAGNIIHHSLSYLEGKSL